MKIEHKALTDVQAEMARVRGQSAAPSSRTQAAADQSRTRAPVRDRLELSAEARALSNASPLSSARVHAIRQQILLGAYDATHVLDAVAKSILQSGDL